MAVFLLNRDKLLTTKVQGVKDDLGTKLRAECVHFDVILKHVM
jgi:hypothetical protein